MFGRGKGPPPITSATLELKSNTNEEWFFELDKDTPNEDVEEIIELLKNNEKIKEFGVDSGGDSGRRINLSFNFERIYEALKQNKSITSISFISTNLEDDLKDNLVEIVKSNPSLEILYLKNEILNITSLCEAIPFNNSLKQLLLPECGLGFDEVEAISSMLTKNNSIEEIDLERGFRDESLFCYLLEGLQKNESLRKINLQYCPLGDNDVEEIAKLLKTKKWRSLTLYFGCCGSSSLRLIEGVLKKNIHLEELILEYGNLSKKARTFLKINKRLSHKPCWNTDLHSLFEKEFDEIISTFLLSQNFLFKDKCHLKIPKPILSKIFDDVAFNFLIQLKLNYQKDKVNDKKKKKVWRGRGQR